MSEAAAPATPAAVTNPSGTNGAPAAPSGDASAAAPEKHTYKVGDQTFELTAEQLDGAKTPEDIARRKRAAGLEKSAEWKHAQLDKKQRDLEARERAVSAKQAEADRAVAALSQGDAAYLREKLGPKWRTIVEDEILSYAQEATLKPEERERRRIEQERKKLDDDRGSWEKQQAERRVAEQAKAYETKIVSAFTKAMETAGMKPTPARMSKMAQLVEARILEGQEPDLSEVIADMQEEMGGEISTALAADLEKLEGEDLLKYLDTKLPNVSDRVRRAFLARARAAKKAGPAPAVGSRVAAAAAPTHGQYTDMDAFRAQLRNRR